ncbi:MAG TPA: hypothetical protein K8V15_03235 [Tessaracoccus flavescens]|uniref:ATP/GTP-binding protein n=1 Tax=Tessaracoccus flavescens TaxID=399497 RepID=A0A921ENU8_9ACTN|nr:hypothetical protein [Tessaracoccus flavescens]
MAKRPSKHLRAPRPLLGGGSQRKVSKRGVEYIVRDVSAQRAEKQYRCPGCQQVVAIGTAHVVTWPVTPPLGIDAGLDIRRHWHTHCWNQA